jgi:hypothetical protein
MYVFIADEFCVWSTILQTCLALRCDIQFVDMSTCLVLQTCLPLRLGAHLSDAPFVALGRPNSGRALRYVGAPNVFVADRFFVWTPILWTRLALRLDTHLADAPLIALGRPTWVRPY